MITLSVLGGVALEADGTPLTGRIAQRRRLALLAILAAHPRGVSRDRLVALLWPETGDERARALLSDTLYVVRKALGDDALLVVGDDVRLNPERVHTDLAAFEAALEGDDAERAVVRYAGPFLDGVHVDHAPELERWAEETRDRLQRRYAQALHRAAAARERDGDLTRAVEHLRRLAALDPGDATATVRLMRALERAGNVAAALQAARVHEALMRDEVGRGPDPDVTRLADRLRREPTPRVATEPDVAPAPAPPEAAVAPQAPTSAPRPARVARARSAHVVRVLAAGALLAMTSAPAARRVGVASGETAAGAGDAPHRVAVLPFVVRGGERSAYLRDAVASLLAVKLDGAGPLQSLDANLVLGRAGDAGRGDRSLDPRAAVALGRTLGAAYVVVGDAVEAGGRLQLNAAMYPARDAPDHRAPEPVARATAEAAIDSVFRAVDTLAVHLLASELARAGYELPSAALLTTSSLPALKRYLDGEAAARAGRYSAAVEAFEAATELDSTFALAYARMLEAQGWIFPPIPIQWMRDRLTRYRDRLPARYRPLADFGAALGRRDLEEAERLVRAAVVRYPEEPAYWMRLAELLLHENPKRGRPTAEARVPFERAVALLRDEPQAEALFHLAQLAAHDRRHAALDSLARRYLAAQPGGEWAPHLRLARALALHDRAELDRLRATLLSLDVARAVQVLSWAASTVPDLRALPPLLDVLADSARTADARADYLHLTARVEMGRGRLGRARAKVGALAAIDPRRAAVARAVLDLHPYAVAAPGELRAARDALAAALAALAADSTRDVSRDTLPGFENMFRSHFLLGALESALGAREAALRKADWLEREAARVRRPLEAGFGPALRAQVHADRGEWEEALAALRPRVPEPAAEFRLLRAELSRGAGRDADAERWYETADSERGAGVVNHALVHLRIAEMRVRRGDRRAAAAHLALAAARWNDADPELVRHIAAVRARLGRDALPAGLP